MTDVAKSSMGDPMFGERHELGFRKKIFPEDTEEASTEFESAQSEQETPEPVEEPVEQAEQVEQVAEEVEAAPAEEEGAEETPLQRIQRRLGEQVKEPDDEGKTVNQLRAEMSELKGQVETYHKLLDQKIVGVEPSKEEAPSPEQLLEHPAIRSAMIDAAKAQNEGDAEAMATANLSLLQGVSEVIREKIESKVNEKLEKVEQQNTVNADVLQRARNAEKAIRHLESLGGTEGELAADFRENRNNSALYADWAQDPSVTNDWQKMVKSGLYLARMVELADQRGDSLAPAPTSSPRTEVSAATGRNSGRTRKLTQPPEEKDPDEEYKASIRAAHPTGRDLMKSFSE